MQPANVATIAQDGNLAARELQQVNGQDTLPLDTHAITSHQPESYWTKTQLVSTLPNPTSENKISRESQ